MAVMKYTIAVFYIVFEIIQMELFLKKYILITVGFASFSIGIVGIFIPVLPTTPFLLLSAGCFLHSSKSLYQWITNHKVFGNYIKNYLQFHAVSKISKVISISLLWGVILTTIILFTTSFGLKILLVGIASGVTIHIIKISTLTEEMISQAHEFNNDNKVNDK